MNSFLNKRINQKKTIRKISFFFIGLLGFFIISSIILGIYVQQNKPKIVAAIEDQINRNINGKLEIQDIQFKYLKGFPYATLALKKVVLKDSLWNIHRKNCIDAKEIEVRLNVWELLQNKISIRKLIINDAQIYFFKDVKGYSNYYLLSPKFLNNTTAINNPIRSIILNNVHCISIDLQKKKHFDFHFQTLQTKLKYSNNSINASINLKSVINKMIFKSKNGSFLKNKILKGTLEVKINIEENLMSVFSKKLKIADDKFELKARINLGKFNSSFNLDLKSTLEWKNLSELVANNIRKKLNPFNFKNPIENHCTISGYWNKSGNPKVEILSKTKNNEFKTPDGTITNCSFESIYSNEYIKGKDYTDSNSIIILKKFKGEYQKIPFKIPLVKIIDLKKPVAFGKIKSSFELEKLNQFIDKNLINITAGNAAVNFDFKINIVDLKLNKPTFTGKVFVSDAHLTYVPKNLPFHDTNLELVFTNKSLLIKNLNFIDRKNSVYMNGKIDDFLYLFYHDTEKIKIIWNIYSPSLDIQQFIGVLTNKSKFIKNNFLKTDSFSSKLQKAFDKSQAIINLNIDKVNYENLVVENLKTTITTYNNYLKITNGSLKTLNGFLFFNGELTPKNNAFSFSSNLQIQKLDIDQVVKTMNNFGLKSLNSHHLKGLISADASVSGLLLPKGEVKQNTISLDIKKGTINTLNGIVDFDGQLFPKNQLYTFNFNTQVSHINAIEFLNSFSNFGSKSLKTNFLNGHINATASVTGQLLPNWHLYQNSINLKVNNGAINCLDGTINFDAVLMPKNQSYVFTANSQVNTIDAEQFLYTVNYFNIKSLDKRKIKGRVSCSASLIGTVLSNGTFQDKSLEITIKNGLAKSMEGTIVFDGKMVPQKNNYGFTAKASIKQVNIKSFLETFNNFGITSFQPKNINGLLNATASINGLLQPKAGIVTNSISGSATMAIYDGALLDFEPIKNAWKIIFPFRDFKNITFSSITGNFDINGDKVKVSDFKVNSNVLNFDLEGVYSFNHGTRLLMTIPIRNPKKDEKINDDIEKLDKRDNGIIIRLLAVDGENGKIKLKWNKKEKK